ncbi:MAG: hypothetical protein RR447_09455 [Algoriella sp.]
MTDYKLLQSLQNSINKHRNTNYSCSLNGCNEKSIKSHTLQKNGILKNISNQNHLAQFSSKSMLIQSETNFELKKIGVNEAYTFPGFCKKHDSDIFSHIEKGEIDFNDRKTHVLFAYRAICQEIYRKKTSLNVATDIILSPQYSHEFKIFFSDFRRGYEHGIKNLNYFKTELENELNGIKSKFNFNYIDFDKIDVCISAPQNILDKNNQLSQPFDSNLNILHEIYVTSVINIFPYMDKSYFLIALHDDYKCNWTQNIFDNFKKSDKKLRLKIISDFLTTRFEFWCISLKLKKEIGNEKISKLLKIWQNEVFNFNETLETDFNLFENYHWG